MRKRKLIANAISGLILQFSLIVFNFIFPRLVIIKFGSDVNGLLQSITQFLSYIALLDGGVSAVIRAHLYRSLAENDYVEINRTVNTAKAFYKRIAYTFIVYIIAIVMLLPQAVSNSFNFDYSAILIIIIGASTFSEYYFGISYVVLLEADQRKYVGNLSQCCAVIVNTISSCLLIIYGYSIHITKLVSTIIFLSRPIVITLYCKRRYKIDRAIRDLSVIKKKWSGLGHHIAYFIHTHTDIVVLTLVKGTKLVSIYSVYNMIITAIMSLISTSCGGIEAAFGNMIAKNEEQTLKNSLMIFEFITFMLTTICFTTAYLTIIPFVKLYTKGVSDANYIEPVSSALLILAEAIYCIRIPYQSVVMASGNLYETMKGAFIEVGINIVLSSILVWKYEIAGVAFGTLCAMIYRTMDYCFYISKNIISGSINRFIKKVIENIIVSIFIINIVKRITYMPISSYFSWFSYTIIVFFVSVLITFCANYMFDKNVMLSFISTFKALKRKN